MKNVGVFLARFQPLHNGHEYIIKKMIDENDICIILIGSADKSGDHKRNPFSIVLREQMVKDCIDDNYPTLYATNKKVIVRRLSDFTNETDNQNKEWGKYLYYNILSEILPERKINFYYSDDPSIIKEWFSDDILSNINFVFVDREKVDGGISAPKIRNAINLADLDFIARKVPLAVRGKIATMTLEYFKAIENKNN